VDLRTKCVGEKYIERVANICVYGIFKLDTKENFMAHTDRKITKGNEYAYIIYDCTQEKFYVTLIEKYRKVNGYVYRIS